MSRKEKFKQIMPGDGQSQAAKKQYLPPTLNRLGKVSELTLGANWSWTMIDSSYPASGEKWFHS